MAARVHHHHAVAGTKQEFGLADDADAVVGHAVEEQYPGAVWIQGSDLPAAEQDAIRGAHVEFLAVGMREGERGVGFADEVGRQFAADGMKVRRRDQPARHRREERWQEQQDQRDAKQSSIHDRNGKAGSGAGITSS